MKSPNESIGNRTRDPGSYNAVRQPTAPPRALQWGGELYSSMQPISWHVNRTARPAVWHSSNLHQSINKNSVGI